MEPTLCLYRIVIRLSTVSLLSYDKTDRTLFEDWQESEWMNERSTALHEIWVFLFRQAHYRNEEKKMLMLVYEK